LFLGTDKSISLNHKLLIQLGGKTHCDELGSLNVNIRTEELILWKYVDNMKDDEPDFDEILSEYFEVLQSELKP
jgi:hypothetical protein